MARCRLGALSPLPELLSVIVCCALERLLASELLLALDRSAANLLRETVGEALRGALVAETGYPDRVTAHLHRARPKLLRGRHGECSAGRQGGRPHHGREQGIGAGVARLLASRGMRVVVNYRSSRDKADDVVASIRSAGGQAMAVQADVCDRSAVLGMVEQVRAAMARWRSWSTAP